MIIDKNGFTREKNGCKRLNKPDRKLPQSKLPGGNVLCLSTY